VACVEVQHVFNIDPSVELFIKSCQVQSLLLTEGPEGILGCQ